MDSVAEVENVAGAAANLFEQQATLLADVLRVGKEHDGVEIALTRAVREPVECAAATNPVSSSTVTPFQRSAIRKPAIGMSLERRSRI